MKKILALVLAAAMLMSVCSAFAEESPKTIVKYDAKLSFAFAVPAGYSFDSVVDDGIMLAYMITENKALPNYVIVIGQDEVHEDLPRLNDLDEEAKNQFVSDLVEDLNNPTCTVMTTGLGTEVVVIDEQDAALDLVILTTLYYGCIVSMYVGHDDGSVVTEDELAAAMQFMTDLDFVVAE